MFLDNWPRMDLKNDKTGFKIEYLVSYLVLAHSFKTTFQAELCSEISAVRFQKTVQKFWGVDFFGDFLRCIVSDTE